MFLSFQYKSFPSIFHITLELQSAPLESPNSESNLFQSSLEILRGDTFCAQLRHQKKKVLGYKCVFCKEYFNNVEILFQDLAGLFVISVSIITPSLVMGSNLSIKIAIVLSINQFQP